MGRRFESCRAHQSLQSSPCLTLRWNSLRCRSCSIPRSISRRSIRRLRLAALDGQPGRLSPHGHLLYSCEWLLFLSYVIFVGKRGNMTELDLRTCKLRPVEAGNRVSRGMGFVGAILMLGIALLLQPSCSRP